MLGRLVLVGHTRVKGVNEDEDRETSKKKNDSTQH